MTASELTATPSAGAGSAGTGAAALPPGAATDDATLDRARTDRSGAVGERPLAVVAADSVEHVQEVLRWAHETRTPVIPRGAGSGTAGGVPATAASIVLDLSGLDRIRQIDADNAVADVEPGVITARLDARAREDGLFYAPDPASARFCTIGGNIATNAGGMRCLKYGVTADAVLGLDVVLADGRLMRTGRTTLKGVTGYDLTSLFVGSEGTLGVIVGARLRLRPAPVGQATLAAGFADVERAAEATFAVSRSRLGPSMLELLDARTLATIDRAQGTSLSARGGAMVIAQTDGLDAAAQAEQIGEVFARTAIWSESTQDPGRAEDLLSARRLALPSIEVFEQTLIEDICVPRTALAAAVRRIEQISASTGVTVHTFAHAGDGNLHPILSWPRDAATGSAIAPTAPPAAIPADVADTADRIFELALELGGTLTGEHGIGLLKRGFVARELAPVALDVHAQLKRTFDPRGILNPGKAW